MKKFLKPSKLPNKLLIAEVKIRLSNVQFSYLKMMLRQRSSRLRHPLKLLSHNLHPNR